MNQFREMKKRGGKIKLQISPSCCSDDLWLRVCHEAAGVTLSKKVSLEGDLNWEFLTRSFQPDGTAVIKRWKVWKGHVGPGNVIECLSVRDLFLTSASFICIMLKSLITLNIYLLPKLYTNATDFGTLFMPITVYSAYFVVRIIPQLNELIHAVLPGCICR